MLDTTKRKSAVPLDPNNRRRLESLIKRVGERGACEALDCPRTTLARAAAGLPLRRATAEVLGMRLDVAESRP